MRIEALPNGDIQQWFKHVFFEEDGHATEQTLIYSPKENGIFLLKLSGPPIGGRGYCSQDTCHYTLQVPNNQVEVTQSFYNKGKIGVVGSAEKNFQGRYIWWEEKLEIQ